MQEFYNPDDREYTSKDVYDAVVGTVRANNNDVQGPGATRATVGTSLWGPYNRYDHADGVAALRAAVERGDLITWTDADGITRYSVPDEAELRRIVGYMNEHDYPVKNVRRIAELIWEVSNDE